MSTKMLINAQRAEHLRVAIIEGANLKDYQVEIADRGLCRGNIYRGVVVNIQPSLNAAFIDIGEERHGFLPVADVLPSAYHQKISGKKGRPRIDQVLERGKSILVQVTKDGSGQKGAALTTNLALAGRYLVLTPFDDVRGISRKAEDDSARKSIRDRLKKLELPNGHGAIVRTNGLEQNQTTLNRDLNALLRLWKRVRDEANRGQGPRLLYSDQDLVVQALRDYLDNNISEVIVDSDEVHEKAESYMRAFMPRSKTRLTRYTERLPLFSRYRLESQIDRIYERSAPLPSGGSIVIDGTEALTAIDVNSGRSTRTGDHDESILKVNIEAAQEVARQLRLRDIGGLVVVDFIDMRLRRHQTRVEKELRDAMKDDRARFSVGRISPNGLLEINRQRIKQALRLRTHRPCPTCEGVGTIGTPEFAALNLLRRIEGRAATGLYERVTVALHPELADALQNLHRSRLAELEHELGLRIEVVSAPSFRRSEERIDWIERSGETPAVSSQKPSAALTATDLALPERSRKQDSDKQPEKQVAEKQHTSEKEAGKQENGEEAKSDTPARKRRRRRRKGGAKQQPPAEDKVAAADENAEQERDGAVELSAASPSVFPTEVSAEPVSGEPVSGEPVSEESASEEPVSAESASGESASGESASGESASGESASGESASEESASEESASGEAASPSRSPSRRRRRGGRRRKKTGSNGQQPASGGEQANAVQTAPPADASTFEDFEVDSEPQPLSNESSPLFSADSTSRKNRRGSRRGRKTVASNGASGKIAVEIDDHQAAMKAHAAEPEIAHSRRDTGPSEKLRWQWWGGDSEESPPMVRSEQGPQPSESSATAEGEG